MQKNCKGPQELYKALGEERLLTISLRTFRAVYSGQLPPSLNLFSSIFHQLPEHLKKDAMVAYFESSVDDRARGGAIVDYLNQNLNVKINSEQESVWKKNEAKFFSEKQLQFLASSHLSVRAYNRIVCHESLDEGVAERLGYTEVLRDLVDLGIAVKVDKCFKRSGALFRLPHQNNSPRELVGPASDFISKHLSAFLIRDGSPGEQELGYSFHTCRRSDANKIFEQMGYFKKWVQNMGLKDDHPDEVGFVWMDFARILRKDRDY